MLRSRQPQSLSILTCNWGMGGFLVALRRDIPSLSPPFKPRSAACPQRPKPAGEPCRWDPGCPGRAGCGRSTPWSSHRPPPLDRESPQDGVAEKDRAGFWIEPKLHPLELGAQFAGSIHWPAARRFITVPRIAQLAPGAWVSSARATEAGAPPCAPQLLKHSAG
jgi:hypothetical protein